MKLSRTSTAYLLLVTTALLVAPLGGLARTLEESTETYAFNPGGSVSVENVNGDITIEAWDRNDVRVEYRITGGSEKAAGRVKVKINSDPDHLRIDTIYEQTNRWWGHDDGASVHYSLKVPASAHLRRIETVNGSVEIAGVAGEVEAETVNGGIRASGLRSDAKLSTVNGSVEAEFDRFGERQRVSMESVNGRVEVRLPEDADVEVRAETVHGSLRNDFGIAVDKGLVGSDLRGKLGDGSARLSLETVNGSIEIRRRR